VLPRADQLFANARQRLDYATESLGRALWRNLQEHRRVFSEIAASLRPETMQQRVAACGERVLALGDRLTRRERTHMAEREAKLEGLSRILESVSYRNVLERGFALVRSQDGMLRRRAAAVVSGEELIITFADDSTGAVAVGPPRQPLHRSGRPKKPGKDQGNLF
jgi:exodeoxyribonuclease VII large subunit